MLSTRIVAGAVVLALAWASAGCERAGDSSAGDGAQSAGASRACAPVAERIVDPALLAFLSKARAVHLHADLAEDTGDRAQAIARLEALLSAPMPGEGPEVREVLADTMARLAELRSLAGQYEAAKKALARGLELADKRTHFRGRLMEVLGLVEQRQYKKLLADGATAEAEAAKARAVVAFEQAVAIQDEVIQRALDEVRAPVPPSSGQ